MIPLFHWTNSSNENHNNKIIIIQGCRLNDALEKQNERKLNVNTKYNKALNGIKGKLSVVTNYGVGNDATIKDRIARTIKTIDCNEFVLGIIKYT